MLRMGIVGGGTASKTWYIPELKALPMVRVTGVATPNAEAFLKAVGGWGEFPPPTPYSGTDGWQRLVESPEVDAVIVATPNNLHLPVTLAALACGKHVLVEKPLCRTTEEAELMVSAAQSRPDLVSAVAFKHRYLPNHIRGRELLTSGILGQVITAEAIMAHRGPQYWSPGSQWFFDPEKSGGGCLADLGPHKLDAFLWMTGDRVKAASGQVTRDPENLVDIDAEVMFALHRAELLRLIVSWHDSTYRDSLVIQCTRGWLGLVGREVIRWQAGDKPVVDLTLPAPVNQKGNYDSGVVRSFIAAILGGPADYADFATGRHYVAAVEAAYQSAKTGARVMVSGS